MRGTLLGTGREPTLAAPAPVRRAAESSLAAPQPWLLGALGALPSATGIPVTPLTALQAAAVYGCVRCLSEDLAKLPLGVRRKLPDGGSVPEPRHPLNALFKQPNRWMTGFDFVAYMVTALCLRGNGYAVIKRGRAGEPIELIPVSPDRVTLLLAPNGLLYYMVFHPAVGDAVTLHQDDMLHIRGLSLDGYVGVSPIAAAQDVIGLALATQQHGATLFRQGAQVSGVLKTPNKLSAEAAQRLAQNWRDVYGGVANSHKVAVLEEGLTFEKLAMTNEDAQYLATRGFQVTEICRIYRVPPHKVMDLSRATFSNIENQEQQYINDGLMPNAARFEPHCERNLLFEDEQAELEIRFDFEALLRGDFKSRMEGYQIGLMNGIYSRNEVRRRENLPPVEGGDEYRVPLNTGNPVAGMSDVPAPPGPNGTGQEAGADAAPGALEEDQ